MCIIVFPFPKIFVYNHGDDAYKIFKGTATLDLIKIIFKRDTAGTNCYQTRQIDVSCSKRYKCRNLPNRDHDPGLD